LPAPEGGKASSRRLAVFSLSTAVSSSPRGPHGRFRRRRGSHSDRRLIVGADRRGAGCCGRRGKLGWSAGRHDESARTSCRCRLGRACGHGGPRYRCGRRSAAPGDSRREGRDRRTNAPVGAVTASAITGDDLPDLVTAAAGRLDIRAVLADGSLRPVLEQPIDVAAPQGIATLLDPDGLAVLDRASRAMTFLEVSDFGTVDRRHPLVVTGRAPLGDDPVAMASRITGYPGDDDRYALIAVAERGAQDIRIFRGAHAPPEVVNLGASPTSVAVTEDEYSVPIVAVGTDDGFAIIDIGERARIRQAACGRGRRRVGCRYRPGQLLPHLRGQRADRPRRDSRRRRGAVLPGDADRRRRQRTTAGPRRRTPALGRGRTHRLG
jgi:hypothetical protein